jgi:hypothetical protein
LSLTISDWCNVIIIWLPCLYINLKKKLSSYFTFFIIFYLLYVWITRRVSYKKQDLFTLCEHLSSSSVFWWGRYCSYFYLSVLPYYVFIYLVPCCDVRYDFQMKTMFGSSLPLVVCRRAHVLFMLFVFVAYNVLTIWVAWRVSYRRQELLTLREHLSSPQFVGVRVAHLFCFCVVLLCVFTLWVPYCGVLFDFCIKLMFGSSLSPVFCRRAHVLLVFVCV